MTHMSRHPASALSLAAALAMSTLLTLSPGTARADGDAAKGETVFRRCAACHMIARGDEILVRGNKVGPNLYGVIGRQAGTTDFRYGGDLVAAGEAGLVWDEETLAAFITDPGAYLGEVLGKSRSATKMTMKFNRDQADVAAYLATFKDE